MKDPQSVVLWHSVQSLCLFLLYFLLPLLKHLHHPLAPPPLFATVEKILVIIFLEGYGCGLRLFEGKRQSATNIIQSPSSSPESRVAKAKTAYDPQTGNPRSSIK